METRSVSESAKIPVITVDGPSGVGKGALSAALAKRLGWVFLDSGAVYRILAWRVLDTQGTLETAAQALPWVQSVEVVCHRADGRIEVDGEDVSANIRTPECSQMASRLATLPVIRDGLSQKMKSFQVDPGLVADGRDMGTHVFPDAECKFFLTASAEVRAERRFQQLQTAGVHVILDELIAEIRARDHRDATRAYQPLRPADDAVLIDTTVMSASVVLEVAMAHVRHALGW